MFDTQVHFSEEFFFFFFVVLALEYIEYKVKEP